MNLNAILDSEFLWGVAGIYAMWAAADAAYMPDPMTPGMEDLLISFSPAPFHGMVAQTYLAA